MRAVLSGAARSLVALRPVAAPRVAPASAIPDDATTLPEMLEWHARAHPQRTTLTLLAETDAGPSEQPLSCGDLLAEASRVAAGIAGRGIER